MRLDDKILNNQFIFKFKFQLYSSSSKISNNYPADQLSKTKHIFKNTNIKPKITRIKKSVINSSVHLILIEDFPVPFFALRVSKEPVKSGLSLLGVYF